MSKLKRVPLRHLDVTVLLLVVGFSVVPGHRVAAQDSPDTLRLYSPHDPIPRLDPNGFLFNPAWLNGPQTPPDIGKICRFRVATGELEERTLLITKQGTLSCLSGYEDSVVTLNEAGSTLGLGFVCATNSQIGTVRGHINWFPVTATGLLRWVNYAGGAGADNDLSFSFLTPTPNAVTRGNDDWGKSPNGGKAYHIELNYSETLYRLGKKGQGWWNALNGALQNDDAMKRLVNDRLAIVTGLFGLDGVHKFQAELHPVFAMAVLIDTIRTGPHRLREDWAVMVRSRGNLGDCSTGAIPLVTSSDSIQQFVMDLGRWSGAAAPRLTLGPSWTTDSTNPPRARLDSTHLFVGFRYPHPGPVARDFLFLGTIYVEWATEGSGTPLNRFELWLPAGTLRQVKLVAFQPESLVARRAQELPVGHPGREALQAAAEQIDTLSRVGVLSQPLLDSIDTAWHPADNARTETTVQFPVPKPVGRTCPAKHDPICRSPIRVLAMGTVGLRGPSAPPLGAFIGVYALSQALDWLPDPLKGIGYRLDGRLHDRFHRSCDTGCTHRTVAGWSTRLSGVLAPNTFPLGHFGTLTTYFIGGVGVFRTHQHATLFEWQAGFGGYFYNRYSVGVFTEVVNYNAAGGLGNHWVLNFGSAF
jgi:hypothetical protein